MRPAAMFPGRLPIALALGALLGPLSLGACLSACQGEAPHGRPGSGAGEGRPSPRREIEVLARSPEIPTYPCVEQCHAAREPNPEPRVLRELHTTREVHHGPVIHWCGFCHLVEDADRLRLLDGRSVSFDEPHRLCGQCHGDKLRDWEAGIHGLTTGSYRGRAQRRTCTACHDPHGPSPIRLEALPPPYDPSQGH